MRSWTFPIALDATSHTPIFAQIALAIANDIARGRLKKGDSLPGTRTLAETLGVHRTTVTAAYAELDAQGWVATRRGSSTFVATDSPDMRPRRFSKKEALQQGGVAARTGFALEPTSFPLRRVPNPPPGALAMWGGTPDLRLVPVELLARAYRRAARDRGGKLLGYCEHGRGHDRLRDALATMVSTARGITAERENVMVTRGSQMALDLVTRVLVRPGDVVAVESPGYQFAFALFSRAGARVLPIRVDEHGLDVDELARHAAQSRVRFVYVTPHHQFPTTTVLSPTRRLALLELARKHGMAIVEDDYDQEFHYDGRPVLPLASADAHGHVIYLGTLSKILAPGLRLGFVVAPEPLVARLAEEREIIDRQGDMVLESAVAELLEEGEVQRHVRRMRRAYRARRDALCEAVDKHLSSVVRYERPRGGLALWCTVSPDVDADQWLERARAKGVHFQTGREFTLDASPAPHVRFGYAMLHERELTTAVRRMAQAL
ncbi:PLP-dependent aminotransferase family protein [Pendulispora albinea]|uniref:PLP-dependent aminotransferase family protein n=1 Tax=Pendulispora albinea TaxID=2741071 RepID=A0ABZ2LWI6_9BACT